MALTPEDSRKLGGSDIAALVGLSPWSTPLTVYVRVVAGDSGKDSPALKRGRLLEPVIRQLYADETGVELLGPNDFSCPGLEWRHDEQQRRHSASLRHPSKAFVRASLDDVGRRRGGGRHAVEYKSVWPTQMSGWGESGTDEVPDYYGTQVAWYLGTGLASGALEEDTADVAALFLGVEETPRVYHLKHDADVYGWLLEAAERFWTDHVVPQRPPPPTRPADEGEAVRRLYSREREPLASFDSLPAEERGAVLAYLDARREAKASNDLLESAEVRLKLALGWRSGIDMLPVDSGVRRLTWKSEKEGRVGWKQAFDSLAKQSGLTREQLDALLSGHRGEAPRTLRVTEAKEK